MKRRTYLAGVGAIGGYLTAAGHRVADGLVAPSVRRAGTAGPRLPEPELVLTDVSADLEFDGPATVDAFPIDDAVTPASTARISIVFTWNGDRPGSFGRWNSFPLNRERSDEETPGLLLLDPDEEVERDDERWVVAPESRPPGAMYVELVPQSPRHRFEPGESVAQLRELWADGRIADRIEPGRYQFTVPLGPVRIDEADEAATDVSTPRDESVEDRLTSIFDVEPASGRDAFTPSRKSERADETAASETGDGNPTLTLRFRLESVRRWPTQTAKRADG